MPGWPQILEQLATTMPMVPTLLRRSYIQTIVDKINARETALRQLDDAELRKAGLSLRFRAKSGEPTGGLLPECYALIRESARRTIGLRHYDVQLVAGVEMHGRTVVQMQTGEGKTLAATLPLALHALSGRGAYLATANDYLAHRDADWMRPAFAAIGLSVGTVESQMPAAQRRAAYQCDIAYGTAKEFGFDFLRDRLAARQREDGRSDWLAEMLGEKRTSDDLLQPPPNFILVDEADSILLDDARTPLVISSLPDEALEQTVLLYRWSAEQAPQLNEGDHFTACTNGKQVALTSVGRRYLRGRRRPEPLLGADVVALHQHVERAISVLRNFQRDRHYVIRQGEVVIVDENTGRLAEGRRWRDGIHQAIEAKEGLDISPPAMHAARVTMQEFFSRFPHVAGMTGTIAGAAAELRTIFRLGTAKIPTHRPPKRQQLPTEVYGNADAKWAAVVREICAQHKIGRPVLVGTRTIERSEHLSALLHAAGIEHQVLNARHVAAEAGIIAAAGRQGKVTIATNMAGRGTDIVLGPGVEELGGLHVVCTELHDSARIDRQLIGRCGRQGDPGSYRQFVALDDDILRQGFGDETAERYAQLGRASNARFDKLAPLFAKAQAAVEREHFRARRLMMHHQRQLRDAHQRMGLDPFLDAPG